MSIMQNNIKTNGFRSLMATQFLGAFNDNAFKFVIAAIIVDYIDRTGGSTLYLALSGAFFILPFIIFSNFAGYLADRHSKQKIIIATKIAELFIMAVGLWALLNGNMWPMLTVLFFMGMQSAFFSPSKYGILPEILTEKEISEGNGIIQMWTYVAILLGQTSYGVIMHYTEPHYFKASYIFMAISAVGIVTSLFVTKVKPSGSARPFEVNIVKEFISNIRWIKKDRAIFLSILGLAYFGFLAGLFQLNVLLYAKKILAIGHLQTGVLISSMTVGIGMGCFLAGKLSDRKIELGLVPLGSIGLSLFSILLGCVTGSLLLAIVTIFMLGISCGFYIIPLNALIQEKSPHDRRGQVIATNNILSFSAIMLGSFFLYALRDLVHLNAAQIFITTGLLTIAGTVYITSLLPYPFVRFIVWLLTHTIYRIKAVDVKNVPEKGGVLLTPNHISYVDAILLIATITRPVRFMIHQEIYDLKILNPFMKLSKAIPVAKANNPKGIIKSLNAAKEALKNGEIVCIFPEGQLTRTGNMLKFNKGVEKIMEDVDCPIVPVNLDRVWGSIFSYEGGKYFFKMPKIFPYPVTVMFGKAMPAHSSAFSIRQHVQELGSEVFKYRITKKMTLPEAFWKEARKVPLKKCIADSSGKSLNYASVLISSVALADQLQSKLNNEQKVGIMLPPSVGGVLSNIAVSILNRIPVNLNYTASRESLRSSIEQCQMKYVVTSRTFLEKINCELPGEHIYVEDVIKQISSADRIKAALKSFVYPTAISYKMIFGSKTHRRINQLATIMFTSGSTGEPKGVMLTHSNITSNLEGLYQVLQTRQDDMIMGILPLFHSFGFTATMWFPLISGVGAVYHVNPLDAKMIGKLVEKHKASVLMSTPTFLNAYIKRCTKEQFKTLRLVVVGAEKLKDQVADAFKEKFGLDVMEGYGCTELSPIVSLNLPDYRIKGVRQKAFKRGKIGLPLPGIAARIIDQNTQQPLGVEENGLLQIKGPNVMKGYLNKEEKTREVLENGWYTTGDIANIDDDGFIAITDRVSRFSKIAGEMVPHIKVEEKIHQILNSHDQLCVVTSVPDEKKGERLVVLYVGELNVKELVSKLQETDLPKLWIPSTDSFFNVESIPVLGTGKLDLSAIKRQASLLVMTE